jgi:di/tricarboxylate transporter
MVYGPGGYRFEDFIRFGAPLQILLAIVTVLVTYTLYVS